MPTRRTNERIGRRRDGTRRPRARKRREENTPAAHDVAVCARRSYIGCVSIHSERRSGREPTCDERHAHRVRRALEERHLNRVLSPELPIGLRDRKRGLLEPLVQIRRNVHLDPEFLWIGFRLWIRTRNQHATVREERRLGVVQPCDDRVAEDREALADRLRRVIQERVEVGVTRQSESGHTLVGTVQDHVRSASDGG